MIGRYGMMRGRGREIESGRWIIDEKRREKCRGRGRGRTKVIEDQFGWSLDGFKCSIVFWTASCFFSDKCRGNFFISNQISH